MREYDEQQQRGAIRNDLNPPIKNFYSAPFREPTRKGIEQYQTSKKI